MDTTNNPKIWIYDRTGSGYATDALTNACQEDEEEQIVPDMPAWLADLYQPIASGSYYEPDEAAPIWQDIEEDEEELASDAGQFEYTLPENGRTYRTRSGKWLMDLE